MPPTDVTPRAPSSPWVRWGVPAIVLVGVLTYANAVRGDFVFDDIKLIVNNDAIKSVSRLPDILLSNLWGVVGRESNYYRPLPPLIFMALHALFGLRPEPFHLVNIVLHAGTAALVYLLARRLLRPSTGPAEWPALAAGLLFAVHPLHTEAVAWISGIMDVACAFFSLLALWAYVRADDTPRAAMSRSVALVALFLALLSKEPAAAVLALFVGYDVLFRRDRLASVRAMVQRWGPACGVFAVYLTLRGIALGGFLPSRPAHDAMTSTSLANIPALLWLYVAKLFVPTGLNVVHDLAPATSFASATAMAGLALAALGVGLAVWAARREPAGLLALGIFFLSLVPALYFPALSQGMSRAFAERYAYLPSAGLVLLVAVALARLAAGHRTAYGAVLASLLAVSIVFSGMTFARNRDWRDSYSLWSDSVRKSPNLPEPHENLGLALMRRGQPEAARRELEAALRLDPGRPAASMASGLASARAGQILQAILAFQTALAYRPDLVEARYNLAVAFESRAWTDLAVNEYRAVLARDARHADAHNNLGILLAEGNQLDEAITHFEAALRARPNDAEVHMNLARAQRIRGSR